MAAFPSALEKMMAYGLQRRCEVVLGFGIGALDKSDGRGKVNLEAVKQGRRIGILSSGDGGRERKKETSSFQLMRTSQAASRHLAHAEEASR